MKLRGYAVLVTKANMPAIATRAQQVYPDKDDMRHTVMIPRHVSHVCSSYCMFKQPHMHFMASKCMGPLAYKQNLPYCVADVRQAVA